MFNNKEELKEWIINYIEERGKNALVLAIRNSNRIKECIIKYTNNLPTETKFNQRCYHIINDIVDIPLCKECGVKNVNFNNRNKIWTYLDFCSPTCGTLNKDTSNKLKTTCIEKYGVDNYSKTKEFKERMVEMNQRDYGVDWYQQSVNFKNKSKSTQIERYGVDNYSKTEYFKERFKKTCIEKYGVDHYSKSVEFKDKFFMTNELEYGSIRKDSTFFKYKNYTLPTGELVKLQGYEPFALDILLSQYDINDISMTYIDIKNSIGIVEYVMNGNKRMYIPDFYINSSKKIIEVKSTYTYKVQLEKNLLKKQACLDMGLLFEFWIISPNGELIDII